jgi:hypothetical protein
MEISGQLSTPSALPGKKQRALAVISMLYDNSVCTVKTNQLVLFREIMAVFLEL